MSFQSRFNVPARLLLIAVASGLSACTINNALEGDKVDYKTKGAKSVSLEIPPDLTQLSPDQRYQTASGTISASTLQTPSPNSCCSGSTSRG